MTGCGLVLVGPLGFQITDRWLKRAGLDYWAGVEVEVIENLDEYLANTSQNFYFFSSKATKLYTEVAYTPDDLLIFGSETTGLPNDYFLRWPERFIKLPMVKGARCLNLATSVGVGIYEALRQIAITVGNPTVS